jgi:hypothetical protein
MLGGSVQEGERERVWVKCIAVCQFRSGSSLDSRGNEKAAIVIIIMAIGVRGTGTLGGVAGRAGVPGEGQSCGAVWYTNEHLYIMYSS